MAERINMRFTTGFGGVAVKEELVSGTYGVYTASGGTNPDWNE